MNTKKEKNLSTHRSSFRVHRSELSRKSGQVMIFFIMAMVILTFMILWNFDLHKLLYVKNITQNGGDAASLMAARWQATTINTVGDLNLMQAIALSNGDDDTAAAISNIQARLLFVGPMVALQASQQAAKNNGIFPNPEYSDFIREHADEVRYDYPSISGATGQMLFPEPYPNAWPEYADMLDLIANDGVSAGPDNMHLYSDIDGGHTLYTIGFYDAIAGRNWCWFYHNEPTLLEDYSNFFPVWWSQLPAPPVQEYRNSEFYGLNLSKVQTDLNRMHVDYTMLDNLAGTRNYSGNITATSSQISAAWYIYNNNWDDWDAMSDSGGRDFPLTGTVKDQYNYSGADAAVRIEATTGRLTPGHSNTTISNTITWTSAAKPFGYLNQNERPIDYGLVIPAFHDVRLIPVDASSAPAAGGFNLGWRRHIEEHLSVYMNSGPGALSSSCYYCRQLKTWESPAFRQSGVNWLQDNSSRCTISGDGGGRGGGTRRGH
jgi:hypothetical protein